MAGFRNTRWAVLLGATVALAGCQDAPALFKKKDTEGETANAAATSTRLVERDVEAPEVFQVSENGLWDGRPSLGGVWVAYPDVGDPERVIIRNEANGKFVIGALFRREREHPGPKLQVSSDAASALALIAGQPTPLNVTALRREEVAEDPAPETAELEAAESIEAKPLDGPDPIASAAAAIDKAEGKPAAKPAAAPAPKPAAATPKQASKLDKPYIQIGIFSVEENANRNGTALRTAGIIPSVKKQTSKGKTFWRVTVGPARTASERASLLKKIKGLGYSDAYFVSK